MNHHINITFLETYSIRFISNYMLVILFQMKYNIKFKKTKQFYQKCIIIAFLLIFKIHLKQPRTIMRS